MLYVFIKLPIIIINCFVLGGEMKDDIIKVASKMYGISIVKSRLIVEKLLHQEKAMSDFEILKCIGEKSLFYLAP